MATFTADRAAASFPTYQPQGSGNLSSAYGSYALTANPTAADIIKMCKLPAGAVVVGGFIRGDDIDTGTETLDIDVGWAANGGSTTPDAADPDGFGNFGLFTGDVSTDVKPEVSNLFQLNGTLKSGPVVFTKETTVQIVINAIAATFAAGTIWVRVDYLVP